MNWLGIPQAIKFRFCSNRTAVEFAFGCVLFRSQVVKILTTAEEVFVGQPHAFRGWTKLECIYRKALRAPEGGRRALVEFLVETLYHMQATGVVSGGEFSKRALQGDGRKTVSILDVIAYRHAIAQKIVSTAPKIECRPSLLDLVAPRSCAKLMGIGGVAPGPGADDAAAADQASLGYDDDKDMFWRWSAKLPQSGVLAAEALRDLHAGDIDGTIRYILKEKRGATMEEVFQTGIIKDVLVNIEQQRQAEAQPEPVVEAAPLDPEQVGSPPAAPIPAQAVGESAVAAAPPSMESDMQELISQWCKHVRSIWRRRVNLLLTPIGSPQVQLDALKRTPAGQFAAAGGVAPRAGSRRAFVLDAKVGRQSFSGQRFGEPLPLERSELERAQKLITNMTETPGVTMDTDLLFVFDGKMPETRSVISKVFQAPEWKETEYSLVYKYDDLEKRLHHTRSETMIRLTERLAILSVKPLRLNFKKRLFFGGSNRCDAFVNVPLEFDGVSGGTCAIPLCKKKEVFQGRAGVPVGKAKACPSPSPAKKARSDPDMEDDHVVRVFPDAPHVNVPLEMRHCFDLSAVVDMFVGGGSWARMCITHDMDYTGFCFNESHRDFVSKTLDDFVFDQIAIPGTPMYRETFAKAVQAIRERHGGTAGGGTAGGLAPQRAAKEDVVVETPKKKNVAASGGDDDDDDVSDKEDEGKESELESSSEAGEGDEEEDDELFDDEPKPPKAKSRATRAKAKAKALGKTKKKGKR